MKKNARIMTCVAIVCAVVLMFLAGVSHADCTIISALPATISSPGNYCLTSNLSASLSQDAITINADDVVIDLGGYEINNTSSISVNGIYTADHSDITVRNGRITGTFNRAIYFYASAPSYTSRARSVIENMSIKMDSITAGIDIKGKESIVRNNILAASSPVASIGIQARGYGDKIENNDVYNLSLEGIYVSFGNGTIVENNKIGLESSVVGSMGIWLNAGIVNNKNVLVSGNRITNMDSGVSFDMGGTGKFRDNLTIGCNTSYQLNGGTGYVDAGNNN